MLMFRRIIGSLFLTLPLLSLEININQIYPTGVKAAATLYGTHGVRTYVRIYQLGASGKTKEVIDFIKGEKNASSVRPAARRNPSSPLLMLEAAFENFQWSVHEFARRYMTPGKREELRALLKMKPYSYPFKDRYPEINLFQPLAFPLVHEREIENLRNWYSEELELPKMAAGFYLVEVSQGRNIAFAPYIISDIVTTYKEGKTSRLIYAQNVQTGKAADGASFVVLAGNSNSDEQNNARNPARKILAEGTLRNGVYYQDSGAETAAHSLVLVRQGDHYSLSSLDIYERGDESLKFALFTDRPVYRQGHEVYLKFFAGITGRTGLDPVTGKVSVTIKGPDDSKIAVLSPIMSKSGQSSHKLILPDDTALGYYRVDFSYNGQTRSQGFYVEAYKKPEFRVNVVSPGKTLSGSSAELLVSANYYSGEPVQSAEIAYEIQRRPMEFPWWYGFDFAWYYDSGEYYQNWEFTGEKTGMTNASGQHKLRLEDLQIPETAMSDYEYRVIARVRGKTSETITGSTTFSLVRGDYSIRLSQSSWYYEKDKPADLLATITNHDTNNPVKDAEVIVRLIRRSYYWDNGSEKETPYGDVIKARTNENGHATFSVKINLPGSFVAQVETRDSKGRAIRAQKEFYVFGGWDSGGSESANLTVGTDRIKYQPGDKAMVRVSGTGKIASTLITAETDEIIGYRIAEARNGMAEAGFSLTEEYSPSVTFRAHAAWMGENTTYASGSVEIILPPITRFLTLQIATDRSKYQPGQKVKAVIRTSDHKGKPVSADFALAVVDESVFAIRPPAFDSITTLLYPKRYHSVASSSSADFRFYSYGKEYKLYSELKGERDRILAEFKASASLKQPDVRRNFRDTAHFTADGHTNNNGTAIVEFTLPDNLTEWRLTAHALSEDGKAGSSRTGIIATKDLAMRLAMPRILREGDSSVMGVIITSSLPEAVAPELQIKVSGAEGGSKSAVRIPAKGELRVDLPVKATVTGKATVTAILKAGENSDGVEKSIPVLPDGVRVTENMTTYVPAGEWTESVRNPGRWRHHNAIVSVVPGTIPAIAETIPYLIAYPYGCVEQTLSTFVPLQIARQLSRDLKIALPADDKTVTSYTEAGLKKLYGYQHTDGGWGWWSDDETHPYMTAYVLDGLAQARRNGVKVGQEIIQKGLQSLRNQYAAEKSLQNRGYMAYAGSLYNLRLLSAQDSQDIIRSANPQLLALHTMTLSNLKEKGLDIKSSLATLLKTGKSDARGFSFATDKESWYWYDDSEETTARALQAISLHNDSAKIHAPDIVKWILGRKREQRWRSTKSSAMMVAALADFARANGEKSAASVYELEYTTDKTTKAILKYDPVNHKAEDLRFNLEERDGTLKMRSKVPYFLSVSRSGYTGSPSTGFKAGTLRRQFYLLSGPDKNSRRNIAGNATDSFRTGEYVLARFQLSLPERSEYLLIESPTPAGFEPVDTVRDKIFIPELEWQHRYANQTVLDDRVAASKTWLYGREWTTQAVFRADFAGDYSAPAAAGGMMYYPETTTWSGSSRITIRDR